MAISDIKLLRERVNLLTLLIAAVVAVVGILLLYFSAHADWWRGREVWQAVLREAGALLLVTVAITLLWELYGKRAFLDEILAKAQLSRDITFSGIVKITDSFHDDVEWKFYFRTVSKLDIFFAYGQTWRNTHRRELQEVATRKDARIRVVLPDPDHEATVVELARRFSYTPERFRGLIQEAEAHFRELAAPAGANGAQVHIWFLPAAPVFSFYRFDRIGILALYTHRGERVPIPTFVCEMGGTLYDYIRKEFDSMIGPGGRARRVAQP